MSDHSTEIVKVENVEIEVFDDKVIDAKVEVVNPDDSKLLLIREIRFLVETLFVRATIVICLIGMILFAWSNPVLQTVFFSVATYVINNYAKLYLF